MKRRLVIGLVISTCFLVLALRDVEWARLWQTIKLTRWPYLLPAIVISLAGHYFRAWRWKYILVPVKNIATSSLFAATCIGLAANNVLPARLGEIVRAHILGRAEDISRTASFATIVYERIIDVFSLLVLLWIMLLQAPGPAWLPAAGGWMLGVNVALLLFMVAFQKNPKPVIRVVAALARPLPASAQAAIDRWAAGFVAGLASVSHPWTLAPIVLASVLVWGAALYAVTFSLQAVGIVVPLSAGIAVIVVVSLGSMIPSAPAYVGTVQYACIVALGLYGVAKSEALAFSLVYHAFQVVPITTLGIYYLVKSQVSVVGFSRGGVAPKDSKEQGPAA